VSARNTEAVDAADGTVEKKLILGRANTLEPTGSANEVKEEEEEKEEDEEDEEEEKDVDDDAAGIDEGAAVVGFALNAGPTAGWGSARAAPVLKEDIWCLRLLT
jgi:hypothetical protein